MHKTFSGFAAGLVELCSTIRSVDQCIPVCGDTPEEVFAALDFQVREDNGQYPLALLGGPTHAQYVTSGGLAFGWRRRAHGAWTWHCERPPRYVARDARNVQWSFHSWRAALAWRAAQPEPRPTVYVPLPSTLRSALAAAGWCR